METKFSHEDSLRVINEMISTAKGNLHKGAGNYFLLWGYLTFLTSVTHFLLINFTDMDKGKTGVVWLFTMVLGGIITSIMAFRDSKKITAFTYTDLIVSRIWTGFMFCIVLLIFGSRLGWNIYPAITFIYMFALYISSVAYQLKWMYISVALCFVCLILYNFVPISYYPLLMAGAMLVGNIAPGHLLNFKAKKQLHV